VNHNWNLVILGLVEIIGGVLVISISMNFIKVIPIEPENSPLIIAAVIAFFGTIISLIYKEVSAMYSEQKQHREELWKLVFPLITKGYLPWIESGDKLSSCLNEAKGKAEDSYEMNRALYFICLFFGIRLRFIIKQGGAIILKNKESDKKIRDEYKNLKDKFNWVGTETAKHVSELQNFFIENDKEERPLVYKRFEEELSKTENNNIKIKRMTLKNWLDKENNCEEATKAIDKFVKEFRNEIDEFSGRK